MARLTQNSTPAERALGCSFAETFETSAKVVDNGGTVTGAPTIDHGVTLNGTSEYITYAVQGHEFGPTVISVVAEFWPDFEYTENLIRYIVSANANGCLIFKHDNGNSNALVVYLGGAAIASVNSSVYGSYWNVNAKNVVQVMGTSGDTDIYLNGVFLQNSASAFTTPSPTSFFVGASSAGNSWFKGTIKQVKVFNRLLTASDALNYYNGTTYTYRNRAILDLPMLAAQHDAANVRTLDVSGSANHATFGDGSTGTTYPTKLTERGYSFDGVDDYMELTDVNTLEFTDDETIFYIAKNMISNGYVYSTRIDAIGGFSSYLDAGLLVKPVLGSTIQTGASTIVGTEFFSGCVTRNSNISTITYLNGIHDGNAGITGSYTNGTRQLIGARGVAGGGISFPAVGDILSLLRFDFALSPLQIADLHHRMMKGVNRV